MTSIWSYTDLQGRELDYADEYYMDRISVDHITAQTIARSLSSYRASDTLFVLLKRSTDYNAHSLFREHQYHCLADSGVCESAPQKLILVYHHVPDNPWFYKPNAIRIVNY